MAGFSRSYLNPGLVTALQAGKTYGEWLNGRVPAVDYARISGDQAIRSSTKAMTREKGLGIRHQHADNQETAEEHDLAIVRFYEDNNITAAEPDVTRPGFVEMCSHVLHRRTPEGYRICAVIAQEYERVWRLPEDYIRFRRAVIIDDEGLFIERNEPYDMNRIGSDIVDLISSGGSGEEVQKTKERVTRNARRRALDGTSPGGRRRFGWLAQDARKGRGMNMQIHLKESRIVRRMIEDALQGRSWKSIARSLNECGVKSATGKEWSGETVRQLLVNPTICGLRAVKGELIRDPITNEPIKGKWESIATTEEWQALVNLSKRRGAQRGIRLSNGGGKNPGTLDSRTRKYMFSGFLRCGNVKADGRICNSKIGGVNRPSKSDPDRWNYVCVALDCGGVSRHGAKVDEFLEEFTIRALEAKYKKAAARTAPWGGEEMLKSIQEKLLKNEQRWMGRELSDAAFYRMLPQLEDRVEALESDRQEYELAIAARNVFSGWDRSKWREMDLAQKRTAIDRVIRAVIVLPLPDGRSRRAPFDADLLRVIAR